MKYGIAQLPSPATVHTWESVHMYETEMEQHAPKQLQPGTNQEFIENGVPVMLSVQDKETEVQEVYPVITHHTQ